MKNSLILLILIPLLHFCQKYNSEPYDDYEKTLRSAELNSKGIVIDSLWGKRDSLSYLRLKNVEFIYLKSVKTIPKWITNFDSLIFLSNTVDKSYIQSVDFLPHFKMLETLNLGHSELNSIPINLYAVGSLKHLTIDENQLEKIAVEINKLKNLESINLSNNPLENIPKEICELPKLESLLLENTKITNLPKCLGSLQNLEWINVSGTQLIEFPIEILNAPKLETIHAKRLKLKNYKEVKAICEKKNITFYYDE